LAEALTHPRYWYTLTAATLERVRFKNQPPEDCCRMQLHTAASPPPCETDNVATSGRHAVHKHQDTPTHHKTAALKRQGRRTYRHMRRLLSLNTTCSAARRTTQPPGRAGHRARPQACMAAHAHLQHPVKVCLQGARRCHTGAHTPRRPSPTLLTSVHTRACKHTAGQMQIHWPAPSRMCSGHNTACC